MLLESDVGVFTDVIWFEVVCDVCVRMCYVGLEFVNFLVLLFLALRDNFTEYLDFRFCRFALDES